MDAVALRRRTAPRLRAIPAAGVAVPALALAALLALSLFLRTRELDAGFWIDEGLSVGIAQHALADIPGVLRQDGSPPLYYLLLHGWIALAGASESATHALSVLFALLAVPAALWGGWSLFGRRVGWICAALAALNPFLTIYAQETRMYALMTLLSLLAAAAFLHAFVFERRRYVPVFLVVLATMLYTHNWSLFFAFAAVLALVPALRESREPRRVRRDAVAALGGAGLLFVPWVPTLVFQSVHTGAPWSTPPSIAELFGGLYFVLASEGGAVALLLTAGVGIRRVLAGPRETERTAVLALVVLAVATLLAGWLFSQVTPAWANRYLAVLVGPVILLGGVGLARAGRFGLVGLVLVVLFWVGFGAPDEKSNVREVAERTESHLRPGDLVLSTHPEQTPVLRYYLPPGLRYATTLGPVADPRVMDWRDALARLEDASVERTLAPLLDEVPPHGRLLLVRPIISEGDRGWNAPWTELVKERSQEWAGAVERDGRFRAIVWYPPYEDVGSRRGLRAVLYAKEREG